MKRAPPASSATTTMAISRSGDVRRVAAGGTAGAMGTSGRSGGSGSDGCMTGWYDPAALADEVRADGHPRPEDPEADARAHDQRHDVPRHRSDLDREHLEEGDHEIVDRLGRQGEG